ncbi:MAG TPA: hypothetical protein VFH87_00740, partial [Candidatus Udaeobacter sp.]|nr:hypothetical protein [Candidatus Udaeobacter sp.]
MFTSTPTADVLKGLKTDHETALVSCEVAIHITNGVGFRSGDVPNLTSEFEVFDSNFLSAFVNELISQVTDQDKPTRRAREHPK